VDAVAPALEAANGRVTLAEIDAQREKGWPDFHPEDYCHRCGGRNVYSWHAPDDVWNTVVAGRWQEIICPQCFTDLAREAGVEPSVWMLQDGDALAEARTALRDMEIERNALRSSLWDVLAKAERDLEAAQAENELLREEIQAETEREERLFVRLPFYEALRAERDALRVAVDRVRALCDGREASTPPSTDFHGNPMPALLSVTEVCAALGGETGG